MLRLSKKALEKDVHLTNLVALDRGYLGPALIEWLLEHGLQLIGTHKRIMSFPFTFGDNRKGSTCQKLIEEKGSQSLYLAEAKIAGVPVKALAYRSGRGTVACMFTSMTDIGVGAFVYNSKRVGPVAPDPECALTEHLQTHTDQQTSAQGGSDWHLLRGGLRLITSTVAGQLMRLYSDEIEPEHKFLLSELGIASMGTEPVIYVTREFLMALSNRELKNKLRERSLSISGNKTELVTRLLESPVELSDKRKAIKIIEKWYLKPITTSSMKVGSANERNILARLPDFVSQSSQFQVENIIERGLITISSTQGSQARLATSNDALIQLKKNPENININAAVELKTHSSRTEVDKAKRRVNQFREGNRFIVCDWGTDIFRKLVPSVDHRSQCLHHCTVDSLNHFLYVSCSSNSIIYTVLVRIPQVSLYAYKATVCGIVEKHLGDEKLSQLVDADLEGTHVVDQHTFDFQQKLAQALKRKTASEKAAGNTLYPPAHTIIPAIVDLWNKVKGGQDVVSRILKNIKIDFRSLSPRAFIWIRIILLCLLNSHLIFRLVHSEAQLNEPKQSYRRFKSSLNKMFSFQSFLWKVANNTWVIQSSGSNEELSQPILDDAGNLQKIPKRNRLVFYQKSDIGERIRKGFIGQHRPVMTADFKKKSCIMCYVPALSGERDMHTTNCCEICKVPLCRSTFGNNTKSCFDYFHSTRRSQLRKRQRPAAETSKPGRKRRRSYH